MSIDEKTAFVLEKYDITKSSPEISDLMRRLYSIRQRCGYVEGDKTRQAREDMNKRLFSKVDAFEKQKALTFTLLQDTEELMFARRHQPDDKRLSNTIRKNLLKIPPMLKELEDLQTAAVKGLGLWKTLTRFLPEEVREQRQQDLDNLRRHFKAVEALERKFILEGKEGVLASSNYQKTSFQTVDDIVGQAEQEIAQIPKIDISEGLEQIKEKKQIINQHLDAISLQLDQMTDIAQEFKQEVQVQLRLLDKIDNDVEKYTQKIQKTNERINNAVKKAGGTTRLACCAMFLILLFIAASVIWFAVTQAVTQK